MGVRALICWATKSGIKNTVVGFLLASSLLIGDIALAAPVDGVGSEQEEAQVAPELPALTDTADSETPAATASRIEATSLKFSKTETDAGYVLLNLSDSAAFELSRTAPSEYILSIPGASLSSDESLQSPLISPKGFPGVRSARAVKTSDGIAIRMFVDQNVDLQAYPRGSEILVEALTSDFAKDPQNAAQNPDARAQLAEGESSSSASSAPAEDGANVDLGDDSTARLNPTGIRSNDGSKIYTGRLISLDLQDTDIDNALRIIAEVSNLNIIASDDVSGKVTLRLIDVPWDQALDVILKTNGLDQVAEGNVIRIAPVDKLRQEREAFREAKKAAEALEDLTVQYVRVSYAKVGDLVEQVQSVLTERGTVAEDERTNQIIIRDIKKGHEQAIELIKKLDLRTPQVLLETQIVEGSRGLTRDLGFQWNLTEIRSPATGNATGLNFPNSVTVNGNNGVTPGASILNAALGSADGARTLNARLNAAESESRARIVSRPQIATINNKTAEIKSVTTFRVKLPNSGTSVATGSGASANGGGQSAFQEFDVGITLSVTPQASPDYYVLMDVEATSSSINAQVPPVEGIPATTERTVTSTILVKSGQTFALGGVYKLDDNDSVAGIPWLKDVPVLGQFFRTTMTQKGDDELIFFITPHIVEGSFDPSLM